MGVITAYRDSSDMAHNALSRGLYRFTYLASFVVTAISYYQREIHITMRGIIFFVMTICIVNNYCDCVKTISWEASIGIKDGDKLAKDCEKPMNEYCSNQVEEAFQHVLSVCPTYNNIKNCSHDCVKAFFVFHCNWLEAQEIKRRTKFWQDIYDSMLLIPWIR
ncbi:Hypothetical protein CINCED_3A016362 [Cinara cedri]|uniref:Uncharacterized protein n=1 Tax=Cinara cedri TaxID=506608 RepID=A0A5E4N2I3_9HEMI|nr:Hypothetical protein CINCED_3A016362 [Cinara cedri]